MIITITSPNIITSYDTDDDDLEHDMQELVSLKESMIEGKNQCYNIINNQSTMYIIKRFDDIFDDVESIPKDFLESINNILERIEYVNSRLIEKYGKDPNAQRIFRKYNLKNKFDETENDTDDYFRNAEYRKIDF